MSVVKLRKSGTFYSVFDNDCYVLYYLFGYKINNYKMGFPKSAFNKVINTLEDNKISYEVIGENFSKNFKNLNKYNKFVGLGRKKYNNDTNYQDIMKKILKVSPEKLDQILSTIDTILNE